MTTLPPITTMHWQAVGAWQGGSVLAVALAEHGGDARGLLASRAGVYGWGQPGATVEPMPQGMDDLNVMTVAIAANEGQGDALAFAATATGRLYSCSLLAEGESGWHEIRGWAGLGVVVALAPSPAYASDQTLFVGTPDGIFRTQDGGHHWESCNFGLLDEDILSLVCSPDFATSELLWAGTAGGGFYRSRNSGRAWRESGLGLPDAAVQCIAVSPDFATDRTLYAGMEGHGIYASHDGGENWEALALAPLSVNTLACADSDVLWAGTEDGLWRVVTANGDAEQVMGAGEVVMSVAVTLAGHVAVGLFGNGLWLAENGPGDGQANRWEKPTVVLHAPPVVTAIGDDLFALDTDGMMAHSPDGGSQWSEMASASSDSVFALDGVLVEGEEGGLALYAATGTGLSRWQRNGANGAAWQEIAAEAFFDCTALGVDLSHADASNQSLVVAAHEGALLLSQDGGDSWRDVTGAWQGQALLRAQFAPDNASELVALTVQPNETGHFAIAVWHTIDLGQNWQVLAGLTSGVPAVMMAWPVDSVEHAIFLATQHRVIKLYNQTEPPELQVHQHFFDESLRVTALSPAPDYASSHTIWAATTGGVYRSVDGGMSWGLIVECPLGLPIIWLEVTHTHINAMTLGGHIWRATL